MNTATDQDLASEADQREALADSQRRAAEEQPENFKESETGEKVVEIGPNLTDAPIEGIDPAEEDDADEA